MNDETLFHLALEKPVGERSAFLEQACAGDEVVRRRVEALLRSHETPDSFLAGPAVTSTAVAGSQRNLTADDDGPDRPDNELIKQTASLVVPGAQIGPYKLLQSIGEGGMGTVYMAEQTTPVRRTVALKLIKAGLDNRQVLARFSAERQALALMDHPNIARVFDAGTTDTGRPYFVMELVKGIPITRFCDERRLTTRERLELAIPVCQAVQHAHQKGVIHRDIKPSNVLIALYDGKPVPKVIDFGVAKATGPRLTDQTLYTEFGAVIGTLEYMSPEQAELNQLDIDTRSDIYSLGVLLYELLTGSTPLDRKRLKQGMILELLRVIREEESPRPSMRLSTTEELPSIAACRNIEPRKLSGLVRGEIDWIVMKTLEKDRNRRYQTANGLAADLRRYLEDEPVQACPPSMNYRIRKLIRRHKVAISTVLLVAMVLVVGVVVSTWQAIRATQAQSLAGRRLVAETTARGQAVAAVQVAKRNEQRAQKQEQRAEEQELLARRGFYASQINLANQAFQAGTPARTLDLLESLRPRFDEVDLRTFEWFYLWKLCHPGRQLNWKAHQTQISSVAYSPDGRTLASGGMENIKLWDVATGKQQAVFPQPGVTCLSFSPDGQSLAAGSWRHWESSPRLWTISGGLGSSALPGAEAHVNSVAFSHDGKTLAAGTHDGKVLFWDVATRQVRRTFRPHTAATGVAFSPDDALLVTWSSYGDSRRKVWDLSGEEPRMLLDGEGARCVTFSPDGKTIAAGDSLWAVPSGRRKAILPGHRGMINSVAFSPDGNTVATACIDRMVRLFDVVSGTERLSHANGAGVSALAFSPDGKALVTASGDGMLKSWDMATGQNLTILPQKAQVRVLDISKDGRSMMVAGDTTPDVFLVSRSYILDLIDGRELRNLDGFRGYGALSPDWESCAIWTPENAVRVADSRTGAELAVFPAKQPKGGIGLRILAFSPDGKTLATYANAKRAGVEIWDVPARHLRTVLTVDIVAGTGGGSFSSMAFSPDGTKLAAGTQFNRVRVWDLASGEELILQEHLNSWIYSIAFSPDGQALAAGNDRGTVRLWQVGTGRQLPGSFRGHTDLIRSMAFSPGGETLVTGSEDKTVRFWDVHTGQERMTLTGHTAAVSATQFAPDGHTLATGGLDGTVRLWQAAVDEIAKAFRDELGLADVDGPRAGNDEGDRLRDAGRHEEAANSYRRALARAEQLKRSSSDDPGYAQESARSHFGLGYLLDQSGARAEGLGEQRRAIELFESAESRRSLSPQHRAELALGYFNLANKFLEQKRFNQTEAAYRASIRLYEKLCAEYSTNASYQRVRSAATGQLASLLTATGRSSEAAEMYRELLRIETRDAVMLNNLAWLLSNCTETSVRDPTRAVELAKRAAELAPKEGTYWNTLGVAHYRSSDWKAAIDALTKSMELRNGGDSFDWFFLAMAYWQLGYKPQARSWYDKAVQCMEKHKQTDEELIRFRAEAAALLEVSGKKD